MIVAWTLITSNNRLGCGASLMRAQLFTKLGFGRSNVLGGLLMGFLTDSPFAFFLFVVAVLVAYWLGATASAPVRQRNEARQALRRVQHPPLSKRLSNLAKEMRIFRIEYRHDLPHKNDTFSYISPSIDNAIQIAPNSSVSFSGLTMTAEGEDAEHAIAARRRNEERKLFNISRADEFNQRFSGDVLLSLEDAVKVRAITEDEFTSMRAKIFSIHAHQFSALLDYCIESCDNLVAKVKRAETNDQS